ncbi:Uncharacterized protein DAT39_021802, partial [Clarias magur]
YDSDGKTNVPGRKYLISYEKQTITATHSRLQRSSADRQRNRNGRFLDTVPADRANGNNVLPHRYDEADH